MCTIFLTDPADCGEQYSQNNTHHFAMMYLLSVDLHQAIHPHTELSFIQLGQATIAFTRGSLNFYLSNSFVSRISFHSKRFPIKSKGNFKYATCTTNIFLL